MKNLLIILLAFASFTTKGENYSASNIPEALKENADAVIRQYTVEKEINSLNQVITNEHFVVTIFNKSAQHLGYFYEQYDDLSKITGYKMNLYNKYGKLVDKAKRKDFTDVLAYSQYSLFDDQRIIYNKVYYDDYPYTIEIEFTEQQKQTLFPGAWFPCPGLNIAVENARFILKTDHPQELRIKQSNLPEKGKKTEEGNQTVYTWEISGYKAIDSEPFMPDQIDVLPYVLLAPNSFIYDGVKGNLSSWEAFGKWSHSLIEGRDELSLETQQKIKELTTGAKTDIEKIKILYKYLQDNTRYVSIQLGIGGFQPFSASTVDDTKYGDCKALSNYMKTLLKYAGIESNYVKIKSSGSGRDIDTDFPYQQFNHVILCVPNKGDTVWLECTSQKAPFGYLSSRTQNQHCLIANKNGGIMVKTPYFEANDNLTTTIGTGVLDSAGNLKMTFTSHFNARQYESVARYFYMSPKEQKEALYKELNMADLKIENYTFSRTNKPVPEAQANVKIKVNKYAKTNGNRLFLPLNLISDYNYVPKKLKKRKYPIVSRKAYTKVDTLTYQIPDNFRVEYLPDTASFKSEMGEYKAYVSQNNNKLQYIREFRRYPVNLPADTYENIRSFFKMVAKSDDSKVVLIKK